MRRILYGVTWEDYLKLLDATPDLYLRHTYDEGTLEMMSPRKDHDWVAEAARSNDRSVCVGHWTFRFRASDPRRYGRRRAAEASSPTRPTTWRNEPRVRCKETYEPENDPPPDLVIEVDVTSTSMPRMPVLAKIGVPEIWRLERGRLRFYRLKRKPSTRRCSAASPFRSLSPRTSCGLSTAAPKSARTQSSASSSSGRPSRCRQQGGETSPI